MYSTKLCSRKIGNVVEVTPWLFSDGMTVFCRNGSSQLMLAAPSRPLPQLIGAVAACASGTLMVTALSVFTDRLSPNVGLIPPGLANFQNSERWKASMYCPVPIDVLPNFHAWLATTGDFCVRVSALAPASQLSTLVGSQVWPANFRTSGTILALTVVDALLT